MLTYYCLVLAHWVIGYLIGYESVTALCVSSPLPLNINAAVILYYEARKKKDNSSMIRKILTPYMYNITFSPEVNEMSAV